MRGFRICVAANLLCVGVTGVCYLSRETEIGFGISFAGLVFSLARWYEETHP